MNKENSFIISIVLPQFGINNVEKIDLIQGGFNKNWIVLAQKKKYILKRRPINEKEHSENECKSALLLIKNGILTAKPSYIDGRFCVVQDSFAYSLFEYIQGEEFIDNKRNIELMAEAMAKVHKIKNSLNIHFEGDCIKWGKRWILNYNYASKEILEIINYYRNIEKNIERDKLPKTIVHWDLHPGNVIFSGDKIYVFDLEFVHKDYRIADMANSLTLLAGIDLKRVNYGDALTFIQKCRLDFKKASWFIDAYHKINKISETEIENLPYFLQIAWLGWSFYTLHKKRVFDVNFSDVLYFPRWVEENKYNIINKLKVLIR